MAQSVRASVSDMCRTEHHGFKPRPLTFTFYYNLTGTIKNRARTVRVSVFFCQLVLRMGCRPMEMGKQKILSAGYVSASFIFSK